MKKLLSALLLLSASSLLAQTADYAVVPLPETITLTAADPFILDSSCAIVCDSGDAALHRDALFLQEYISLSTGIQIPLSDRQQPSARVILLTIDSGINSDEGYEIAVSREALTIRGATAAGVFYGIQTIRKALPTIATPQVTFPAGRVTDAPRFAYRGMMLDCARHFFPIEFIKEYIDLLALHNMNRFHWHLSDDQGWRIEIKKYPLLTTVGGWRTETTIGHNSQIYDGTPYGGYYTQDEARQIVDYARQRHITVIPEIDMPGHQQAALAAYPTLGCTGGPYAVGRNWGIYLNILCLGNEQTYTFCEDVLTEIMDIFPSEYIHIGGDEAPTEVVAECERCRLLMQREGLTPATVQGYFTNRIDAFVSAHGRHIIGWDEILEGGVGASAVVHLWRGIDRAVEALATGHDVILSPTSHCYFDFYQADPRECDEPPAIGGLTTVEKVYAFEAVPEGIGASDEQHILGVQANLWTEYIGTTNHVVYMVLPRMAALAETQWCQKKGSFDVFLPRLTRLTDIYKLYHLPYARHLWRDEIGARDRDYN